MDLREYGFTDINHELLAKTKTPYSIYTECLEETAQQQFFDVLNEPYVTYGALMPDAHTGYTMPIGGVCSTKGKVVPQFVGFDIGCGMCAYKTDYSKEQIEAKAEIIYEHIVEKIPLGFKTHKEHQSLKIDLPKTAFADHVLQTSGLKQLGTLGGGNHFIEVGYGADEKAWIVIHSGSRGFGHKIASHYMLQAYLLKNPSEGKLEAIVEDFKQRNIKFKEKNPEGFEKALAKFREKQKLALTKVAKLDNIKEILPLEVESELGQDYIKDQNFALQFAIENRKRMIAKIHDIMNEVIGGTFSFQDKDEVRFINRNHNHADYDEKRDEWIHRKGATHAEKGMRGVIPGNMRDGSFVVIGKGNADSLASSSHGAGRVMSRNKAKKHISMEDFEASMKGITGTVDENTLDESPFAYKDIFEVMQLQDDLVEIEEHIKVLINVKDNAKSRF
ncbi:MAG: RNA-2',3'-PO4:RNA-5'-OH ligase [uncultured Sulfurovum sp.]|uniref:3'-phosphate/5'-hydroxy nucleic acid ligase n=1 Tax=uncultured Sulfurovum sp. TaxID=269237 RepID=A0A6S6SYL4_9BACT|nr:MAG: RNA-2',3'-PO4:RNA-5'-OH ligase [uncultured Sulfurovum sp.]